MLREFDTYNSLKAAHQKDVNEFPMVFMFGHKSDEEIRKYLAPIGAETLDECVSVMGCGDVMKKTDVPKWKELCNIHEAERNHFEKNEKHLLDMVLSEMRNHEYGYTLDFKDTRQALGWSLEDCEIPSRKKVIAKAHKMVMQEV